MKFPEKAAALATELADRIRTEEQQVADAAPEGPRNADEAEETLDSVELIEKMMLGVTENATAILGAEKCTLWLVNPKTQAMWSFLADTDGTGATLTGEDSKDAEAAARVLRTTVGTGLAGTCAATGEVIEVPDAWQDARFDKSHDEKTGFRTRTAICVPILKAPKRRTRAERKLDRLGSSSFKDSRSKEKRVRVVGVMQVLNRIDGKDTSFDSKAVKSLAKLATDAGLVLQATKLYKQITGYYDMATSQDGENHI